MIKNDGKGGTISAAEQGEQPKNQILRGMRMGTTHHFEKRRSPQTRKKQIGDRTEKMGKQHSELSKPKYCLDA